MWMLQRFHKDGFYGMRTEENKFGLMSIGLKTISPVPVHGCESWRSVMSGIISLQPPLLLINRTDLTCLLSADVLESGSETSTKNTRSELLTFLYPNNIRTELGTLTGSFMDCLRRHYGQTDTAIFRCLITNGGSGFARSRLSLLDEG